MLIRDRIFNKLEELNMTQKEFSKRTGIAESTISDWRKKKTNPTAEKIMIICKVLNVAPEWLLSGVDVREGYRNPIEWYVIEKDSEPGILVEAYNDMSTAQRARLMGYAEALREKTTGT